MVGFRSKESGVSKILTSIFCLQISGLLLLHKDLFHSCKQYGHVVDSFIPTKRTKDGKRFGFVRFINVFNVERLVNNLCTIWVGRSKFHANVGKFKESTERKVLRGKTKNESNKRKFDGSHKNVENTVIGKSFVSVVKTSRMPIDKESPPAIVLEDDCLNAKDSLSYLGELWVLLEFETAKAKDSFRGNVGVGSWFSVIKQAYAEFVPEGRLVWVELDGVPFKFWSGPTFKRIAAKWGELLDVDDYDESNLHSKRICILSKVCEHIHESFKIVFRGKVYWVRASEVLGWTPEFSEEEEEDELSVEDNNDGRINDLEANNGIDESDVEEDEEFGMIWLILSYMKDYGENERDDNSFVNLEDVRYKSDRYGSNFNAHDAEIFNSFIYNASLDEVPLGGSAYTWYDYGPIPFRFLSLLLEVDGFDKLVRDSWKVGSCEFAMFDKPSVNRACIDTPFPVSLSIDQKEDMERRISKEEVKRAVWDCGVDKSPGRDDAGLFTGIKINSMVNLSHLFYADDAIFLGQWSELNIDSLVRVLDCFFRASGLRINMCKSKIMGVNVKDGMV
ncbi:nucleotide-binding alpha-beta plait domain-containing protein [Tanacetum coccineum]